MLWPGLTEFGAFSSMIFGLLLGVSRLVMDVVYPQPHCGEFDDRPGFVKLHFMYYGEFIYHKKILLYSALFGLSLDWEQSFNEEGGGGY